MKKVIEHLESISKNLDDALRAMQGPAIWNDLANRAERNADESEARCKRGACLTVDSVYHGDGVPSTCGHCGKPGMPCTHPKGSWCTGCRE